MRGKVCPVVHRRINGVLEILAFRHPTAGKQFVKGSVEDGEPLAVAALRELREESGYRPDAAPRFLGQASIGAPATPWSFFAVEASGLPENWDHQTEDDLGHVFSFFWHPVALDLDDDWHPTFHEALRMIRQTI